MLDFHLWAWSNGNLNQTLIPHAAAPRAWTRKGLKDWRVKRPSSSFSVKSLSKIILLPNGRLVPYSTPMSHAWPFKTAPKPFSDASLHTQTSGHDTPNLHKQMPFTFQAKIFHHSNSERKIFVILQWSVGRFNFHKASMKIRSMFWPYTLPLRQGPCVLPKLAVFFWWPFIVVENMQPSFPEKPACPRVAWFFVPVNLKSSPENKCVLWDQNLLSIWPRSLD